MGLEEDELAPLGQGQDPVGYVIGTDEATPLEFWVGVGPNDFLQLDDVVAVARDLPNGEQVRIYGVVEQLRARQDGVRFDNDVFLASEGLMPAEVSEAAKVLATRFKPETFVPPRPGSPAFKAAGADREVALFFDDMDAKLPAGLSADGQPIYLNMEFLDGSRGAHVNISGVSGVATKTSYATFLLHSVFTSGVLGGKEKNTKALIFNVKGEDLLWLDYANTTLDQDDLDGYEALGLPAHAFRSVQLWAPPRDRSTMAPFVGSRTDNYLKPFVWTLQEFCDDQLLPFLFADAQDERQQYTTTVAQVTAKLASEADTSSYQDGAIGLDGTKITTFAQLCDAIEVRVMDDSSDEWRGRAIGMGSAQAFVRRLFSAKSHLEHIIRGNVPNVDKYRIDMGKQVTVVDLHQLHDRAQRFVVGVMLRRAFQEKEDQGTREPVTYVVLDELNKYAPREGRSPIKEILLDISERGRSLGVVLIGAQQTASEVERRVIANSAIRVVGRLDTAEAGRSEYAWLPTAQRQRSTIIKPGTMLVNQPEIPVPLAIEFPFPAWATRVSEANRDDLPDHVEEVAHQHPDDIYEDLGVDAQLDENGEELPF